MCLNLKYKNGMFLGSVMMFIRSEGLLEAGCGSSSVGSRRNHRPRSRFETIGGGNLHGIQLFALDDLLNVLQRQRLVLDQRTCQPI